MPDMQNDPTTPPSAAPVPGGGAGGPDDAAFKQFNDHVGRHPQLRYLCDKTSKDPEYMKYEQGGGGADPAFPSAENGDVPPPGGKNEDDMSKNGDPAARDDKDKLDLQRQQQGLNYNRLEKLIQDQNRKIEQLQKERDGERTNYARAEAKRRVSLLLSEGYLIKDPGKELDRMAALPNDKARDAREEEIRENYQRAPVGTGRTNGFLRIDNLPGTDTDSGDDMMQASEARADAMAAYVRQHPGATVQEAWEKTKAAK